VKFEQINVMMTYVMQLI